MFGVMPVDCLIISIGAVIHLVNVAFASGFLFGISIMLMVEASPDNIRRWPCHERSGFGAKPDAPVGLLWGDGVWGLGSRVLGWCLIFVCGLWFFHKDG